MTILHSTRPVSNIAVCISMHLRDVQVMIKCRWHVEGDLHYQMPSCVIFTCTSIKLHPRDCPRFTADAMKQSDRYLRERRL